MADYCASEALCVSAAEPVSDPVDKPITRWTKRRMAMFLEYLAEYCNARNADRLATLIKKPEAGFA